MMRKCLHDNVLFSARFLSVLLFGIHKKAKKHSVCCFSIEVGGQLCSFCKYIIVLGVENGGGRRGRGHSAGDTQGFE
jgi:hypothetical protein